MPKPKITIVYPGSFDVVHVGHLWLARQGANLSDRLVVAVADNLTKTYLFDKKERVKMAKRCFAPLKDEFGNVEVDYMGMEFPAFYARKIAPAKPDEEVYILRGARDIDDYDYEAEIKREDSKIAPEIPTMLMLPPNDLENVRSRNIKDRLKKYGWEQDVMKDLPLAMFECLLENKKRIKEWAGQQKSG